MVVLIATPFLEPSAIAHVPGGAETPRDLGKSRPQYRASTGRPAPEYPRYIACVGQTRAQRLNMVKKCTDLGANKSLALGFRPQT
jgi:hypothetical protein